jgi:uncharacterized OsmC-like protein
MKQINRNQRAKQDSPVQSTLPAVHSPYPTGYHLTSPGRVGLYALAGCVGLAVRVLRKTNGTAIAEMTTTESQMAPGHSFWTTK